MGLLSFDYMQTFSTNVNLNVVVNGEVIANVSSEEEQNILKNSGPIEINVAGSISLQFISVNNSDGQVAIDNISWSGFEAGIIVEHGSNQDFDFIPDENYHVSDVLVDGISIGDPANYTFENVTADHSIHVDFAINTYTIVAEAGDYGSINPVGELIVEHGSNQTFEFLADLGYHINDVIVDGESFGALESFTFENVSDDS